ncbi:MAG: HI0074 family nucleotidyltransferase substrate-binding subunit [Candidatus Ratteibacteria bacterium]|nr:HI0074 family nucleotidyltransferase substrate-binding subunit [Candidatus Ratteibacteria bacterium]
MERLKLKYKDAQKALDTLKKIFDEPFSIIIRDAAIQRFEYSFEAFWKFIKEYLKEKEGVIGNSPKTCFREIFSLGYSTEDETVELQEMTDRRNDTSHTYKEEVAQKIYKGIKGYFELMDKILIKLKDRL